MRKNKGIAMAYTIMIMLIVFSLCALITTITISSISYSDIYSIRSEEYLLISQIGEFYCANEGEKDDSFVHALKEYGFEVSEDWAVRYDDKTFFLQFSDVTSENSIKKSLNIHYNETEFIITIRLNSNGTKNITRWIKNYEQID